MRALVSGNAAYKKVRLINVDWDTYRSSAVVSELKIPRRSTLVMFRGGNELERIIAGTSKSKISQLFEAAIAPE